MTKIRMKQMLQCSGQMYIILKVSWVSRDDTDPGTLRKKALTAQENITPCPIGEFSVTISQ